MSVAASLERQKYHDPECVEGDHDQAVYTAMAEVILRLTLKNASSKSRHTSLCLTKAQELAAVIDAEETFNFETKPYDT